MADFSAEVFHVQAAAFNDAFQRPDGNGFVSVHGHNHLPAIYHDAISDGCRIATPIQSRVGAKP
jgi:hypothetical protein